MATPGPPPPSASLEAVRLKGHLGHLTPQEEAAFATFKKICADKGFYKPGNEEEKPSHDDGTLVRYLRARRFIPEEAFAQFMDTEIWRKKEKLEALYENIDIQDYQEARSVYPQWTGRRDKRGLPVYLYEVGKLNSKKMMTYASTDSKSSVPGPAPSKTLRLFALYENLTRFVLPLCSAVPGRPNPETPVDQSSNIVDISKVGLKQFWNLRGHMQDASTLATAHYPETLDRIFVIGAPSFFPTVWGWIKKWFDPITTSKIFILAAHEVKPTLSAFIDEANIPKKYGGELEFECGMTPVLDDAVRNVLQLSSPGDKSAEAMFLTAPVRWVDGQDGDLVALGVGSINGKPRREVVATLHAHYAQNAFPGMSRQNTRSMLEYTVSKDSNAKSTPTTAQAPPVTFPPAPAAVQSPPPVTPPASSMIPPAPVPAQQAPAATFPPPATASEPSPVANGIENTRPGPISMPKPQLAPPMQRTGTEYFTPPIDSSELKRL